MKSAPLRFASAALWPLTIWTSLGHFGEHPADDYVERTSPIVAAAIGFWLCLGAYVLLSLGLQQSRGAAVSGEEFEYVLRFFDRRWETLASVLLYFLPVIYVIGFWMFTAREERYPR